MALTDALSHLTWPLLAGLGACLAMALGTGHPLPVRYRASTLASMAPGRAVPVVVGFMGVATALASVGPLAVEHLALALILGGAAAAAWAMLRRRARARRAAQVSERVVETAELLAAELSVGLTPGQALAEAALGWPALAPVVAAERLGVDVAEAWRELSATQGADHLRLVAAFWAASAESGGGLSEAMSRVAGRLRAARATERVVLAELASARATARLVAALPVVALAMGSSAESRPWEFLVTEPVGLICLAAGLAFGLAGLWWIEAIAAGVRG
jgi:tight adherence protein B